MKNFLYFFLNILFTACCSQSFAQNQGDSISHRKPDTNQLPAVKKAHVKQDSNHRPNTAPIHIKKIVAAKPDTAKTIVTVADTSVSNMAAKGQPLTDSNAVKSAADTMTPTAIVHPIINNSSFVTNKVLLNNRLINTKDASVYFIESERRVKGKEFLFYSLCVIVLILGIFKTFYSGYFKNLFRVYFNTSLRQTQLADQLVQAKLPSFILNIFFAVTTGIYIWLLFNYFHPPRLISSRLLLPFCILSVALLYFIKFCLLKFMGWVSDIQQTTDNYIFAIFLVNKIIGILLVPVVILLAFLNPHWIPVVTNISVMILGLFFLSRYVKSYGAIEKKIPLNPFHFIIYIVGAEIIPLIIIYKVAVDYLI
ncbi:MAG: DUF4271 domain-containing protein [Ginsengibacter sp.]